MTSHFVSLMLVSIHMNNILLLHRHFSQLTEVELMWSLNWSSLSLLKFPTLLQRRLKKLESAATAPVTTFTAYIINAKKHKSN